MTVKDILVIAKSIQTKWVANVVNSRSGEQAQLQSHLGTAASYAAVTIEIGRWVTVLSGLADKPRVSLTISKNLLTAATTSLRGLDTALNYAANGVDWIFTQRNFGTWYALSISLIRDLSLDAAREAEAITNAAQDRISQDINALQTATEQAKNFSLAWPDLNTQISTIQDAGESVTKTLEQLDATTTEVKEKIADHHEEVVQAATKSNTEIETALVSFREAIEKANQTLSAAQSIHLEAQNIRTETQSTATKTKTDLDASTVALNAAIEQEKSTQRRLTKALQNAQMEGLAGSFTQMKEDTKKEMVVEQYRFQWALAILMVIAIVGLVLEAKAGFPKHSTEEFSFRMLRMISLAAPVIWVAWVTSRKLSALSRVFSDYQYKSASALAYESYRQTVAEAGSDELKQQLLAFAIRSFGENPTHYYDAAKNEASSPFESFIEKIPFFGKSKSEPPKPASS